MAKKTNNDQLLLLAFLLSGFVALGYEMVWTRLLALTLGSEILGMLGVLAGFFMGMVLGAYSLSKHAQKTDDPLKMFMILETIIAFYGLLSPYIIYGLSDFLPRWLGPMAGDNNSLLALLWSLIISSIVLLPATFGMGANFAYLVAARSRIFKNKTQDKSLGRVYAANTFGAMLGTLAGVYLVLPSLGFMGSGLFFCLAGLLAVAIAYYWKKGLGEKWAASAKPVEEQLHTAAPQNILLALLFFTGLTAIGLEIVVIHLLKQILENTIYTFANILSIYLVGTAIGAWLYQRSSIRTTKGWQQNLPSLLFAGLLLAMVLVFVVMANSLKILLALAPESTAYQSHLLLEFGLAILVFLAPTILMGALFSFLISRIDTGQIGKAYAINTLGAALAPFIFGLLLIPHLDAFWIIALVGFSYMAIFAAGVYYLHWTRKYLWVGGAALLFLAGGLLSQPNLIVVPPNSTILQREEGLMGTVVVSERTDLPAGPLGLPNRLLQINNQFRMGGGAGFLERRMGNLPFLLAKAPESALFLGIGTGTTLGCSGEYPLEKIVAVEIVPQIEKVLPWFEVHNQSLLNHPALSYHPADARRFVSATDEQYDLIVGDLYHPARDGAGLLYTQEHFKKLQGLLSPKGQVTQWLPVHQFDQVGLQTVIRTFLSVFPNTHAFLAGYNTETVALALVAQPETFTIDFQKLQRTIDRNAKINAVYENAQDLLATYVMGPAALRKIVGDGPMNTDLHPLLLFEAPKSAYLHEIDKSHQNLTWLLAQRQCHLEKILGSTTSDLERHEVKKTWEASGLLLQGNISLWQGEEQAAWQKYIAAYQKQNNFSPARGKLMQRAINDTAMRPAVLKILNERDRARLKSFF